VKPGKFAYLRANCAEEVLGAMHQFGDDLAVLAGGQSLVPLLNMRMAQPSVIVDVNGLPDLGFISVDGSLSVGALVRQKRLENDPVVAATAPLVAEAVRHVGHPAIRSRGTLGGNLAHADPASELPSAMVALGAEMVALGADGERTIPAGEFFVTHYTTALHQELLVGIRIPVAEESTRSAFIEVARRRGDFALVGVAVVLRLDGSNKCRDARIVLSGVSSAPHRATEAEALLEGEAMSETLAAEIQNAVERSVEPGSDLHASARYRTRVSGVIARRAVARCTRGQAA
jgi:aerobic carbon-monoxide dehydrogenase medium subunit